MKSLLRAVQCTESLQKSSLHDRRLPSKVSMKKKERRVRVCGNSFDELFTVCAQLLLTQRLTQRISWKLPWLAWLPDGWWTEQVRKPLASVSPFAEQAIPRGS